MTQNRLTIGPCVSSVAKFTEECKERTIFYLGKWRKVGDRVPYDYAKGWRRLFKFPIVYISPEACAQIQLPIWWNSYPEWKNDTDKNRQATIIGDTVCPETDRPNWMK